MSFVEETFYKEFLPFWAPFLFTVFPTVITLHQRMMKEFRSIFHPFKTNVHILEDDLILSPNIT